MILKIFFLKFRLLSMQSTRSQTLNSFSTFKKEVVESQKHMMQSHYSSREKSEAVSMGEKGIPLPYSHNWAEIERIRTERIKQDLHNLKSTYFENKLQAVLGKRSMITHDVEKILLQTNISYGFKRTGMLLKDLAAEQFIDMVERLSKNSRHYWVWTWPSERTTTLVLHRRNEDLRDFTMVRNLKLM